MKKIIAIGAVSVALVLCSAANANASGNDASTTVTSTQTNQECLAAVKKATESGAAGLSQDMCTAVVTTTAGPTTPVTASALNAAKPALSKSQFASLSAAAAAGAVRSKPYSQSIKQVTDQETQRGTFYYDGSHAWVTVTYRGFNGTHSCNVDYAIGYSITNTSCSDSGSTSSRKLQMNWDVAVAVKGSPLAWSESYTMHVSSAGTISNG